METTVLSSLYTQLTFSFSIFLIKSACDTYIKVLYIKDST